MRRHARSKKPRIVRNLCSSPAVRGKPGASAPAEIGSRVFPLRAPPAAPMPSVGARRSTRIFVPKLITKSGTGDRDSDGGKDWRVLRSGKKLAYSEPQSKPVHDEDEWDRLFPSHGVENPRLWNRNGDTIEDLDGAASGGHNASGMVEIGATAAPLLNKEPVKPDYFPVIKRFGIVYRRKRSSRQFLDGDDVKHVSFARKDSRKRIRLAPTDARRRKGGRELRIQECSRGLAKKVGIGEDDLLTKFFDPMVLVVLVEAIRRHSSQCLFHLLRRTVCWTRRNRFKLWEFAGFLLSGSIASFSAENGVHFLPIRRQRDLLLFRNTDSACGLCKIYGAAQSFPLLWLDFSALPSYFKSLHFAMLLGLNYIPRSFIRYSMRLQTFLPGAFEFEERDADDSLDADYSEYKPSVPSIKREGRDNIVLELEPVMQQGDILPDQGLLKHQRKRSSSRRYIKIQKQSFLDPQLGGLKPLSCGWNGVGTHTEPGAHDLLDNLIEPLRLELPETSDEIMSYKDESDVSTPLGSHVKYRKLAKRSHAEQVKEKELKAALVEVKKNILSAHCHANVLVTIADRCWREEGFEVMLDDSSSGWCIAIKSRGMLRYLHKPQFMKPCVVNRFTHSYMWQGEDGWKLEFLDRWNWSVFKELHSECCERNIQEVPARVIHVPGVKEVSDCDTSSFIRPVEYIKTRATEVQRALVSENTQYDMDSGDEEWLNDLNLHSSMGRSNFSYVSQEAFEKIIYAFEKDAYTNTMDIYDKEQALTHFQDFENRDALAAIYDYWMEKRNRRNTSLMRIFQGSPPQRPLIINPCFRRKRSFKRQRSQSARAKPQFLEALTKEDNEPHDENQETWQRVQKAEHAASRALQNAIRMRRRAQMLMKQAELAAYKSVMALRIADIMQASGSPDLATSILN